MALATSEHTDAPLLASNEEMRSNSENPIIKFARTYRLATCFVVYLVLDVIWLGLNRVKNEAMVTSISGRGLDQFDPLAAVMFYLGAPVFIYYLAVTRVVKEPAASRTKEGVQVGVALGLAMYGTFDLTAKAIFENFTWSYAIVDMIWGMFVVTATTVAASL